jgi:hypothetical protein
MQGTERDRITLKEAAAAYGTTLPRMSRLVRRLGVQLEPNPIDGRSKLVRRAVLERAMSAQVERRAGSERDRLSPEAEERRRRTLDALDRIRKTTEEMERAGIQTIPSLLALDFVRGEITLEELDEQLARLR